MKNLMMLIAVVLGVNVMMAQKTPKNNYVLKQDKIEATIFHDNGQVAQKGFYNTKGKLDGKWTSFDRQGNKTAMAIYKNGKKTGKWFFWDKGILREVDYTNSKITSVNTWFNENSSAISSSN